MYNVTQYSISISFELFKLNLKYQISILETFLKAHVTLKTRVIMLWILSMDFCCTDEITQQYKIVSKLFMSEETLQINDNLQECERTK